MWDKFNEIKKKAVEGLNTATSVATQMAKELILENIEGGDPNADQGVQGNETEEDERVERKILKTDGKRETDGSTMMEKALENNGVEEEKPKNDDKVAAVDENGDILTENINDNVQDVKETLTKDGQLSPTKDVDEQPVTGSHTLGLNSQEHSATIGMSEEVKPTTETRPIISDNNFLPQEPSLQEEGLTDQTNRVETEQEPVNDVNVNDSVLESPKKELDDKEKPIIDSEPKVADGHASGPPSKLTRLDSKDHKPIEEVIVPEKKETQSGQPSPQTSPKKSKHQPTIDAEISTPKTPSELKPSLESPKPALISSEDPKQKAPDCKEHIATIERLSKENSELIADLSTLTSQLMMAKTSASEANSKLSQSQAQVASLSTQLADVKKIANAAHAKQEKEIGLLKEEAQLYKDRIKTLQTWQEDLAKRDDKKEADRIKKDKEREEKERADRDREREKERIEREKRDKAIEEFRKRVAELEIQNKSFLEENLKLRDTSNDLQELVDNNEDEKIKLEAEISKYRKTNDEIVKDKEKVKKDNQILQDQLKLAKDEVFTSKNALMEREAEIIKQIEEKERLKGEAATMIETIKQENQASSKETDETVSNFYCR
jgi:hypothetical protein